MVVRRRELCGLAVAVGLGLWATGAAADKGRGAEVGYFDRPSIWRGLYGGLHIGHADADFDDGLAAGAQLGYNWQSHHVVYGLEGDISFADTETIDWLGSLRGRVGYLLQPGLLVYGTAGLGFVSAFDTDAGFVYGLGVEGRLSDTMSARLEYLSFENDSVNDDGVGVIRAGLNFKFAR
jgi:opacity protein-like surface antigen